MSSQNLILLEIILSSQIFWSNEERFIQDRIMSFGLVCGQRTPPLSEASAKQFSSDEQALSSLPQDESALQFLFDRYSKLVFCIGMRVLHDSEEAQEVIQDVFMSLFQKATAFDPRKGAAKPWIVQLAYYRALDRRNYLNRRKFYSGTDLDSLSETLVGEANLEQEIGKKLDRALLRRAFQDLGKNQRETLELFFFEGMEFAEIAAKLKEPIGNIRHHYYRALEKLRQSVFVKRMRHKA
jgi:RNA polymerase sigma-70 factor (ECF subfamily)